MHGLKRNARSPGSIDNAQHHDVTGAQKNIDGLPGTWHRILADSTNLEAVWDFAMIIVTNTDTVAQFIWIGREDQVPVGAIDITNGLALPAGNSTPIHLGASDLDGKSIAIKTSSALVQVVVVA